MRFWYKLHCGATKAQDINNLNDPQKKYRLGTVSKNILLEGLNQFSGANLALSSDVYAINALEN